jgi:hypothetical protein
MTFIAPFSASSLFLALHSLVFIFVAFEALSDLVLQCVSFCRFPLAIDLDAAAYAFIRSTRIVREYHNRVVFG